MASSGTLIDRVLRILSGDPTTALGAATKQYVVAADSPSPEPTCFTGLELVWNSATSISCNPGRCYIPSLGTTIQVAGQTLTGLAAAANTMLHFYISSTGALTSSSTTPTSYSGSAYSAALGTLRYIGSVSVFATNTITRFRMRANHIAVVAAAPTVFNGTSMSTSYTSVTAASILIPPTATDVDLRLNNGPNVTAGSSICVSNVDAGFSNPSSGFLGTMTSGTSGYFSCPLSAAGTFQYGLNNAQTGTAQTLVIMATGYWFAR